MSENPYIERARVFLKESEGDQFIIAHMQVTHTHRTPEDPMILKDKDIGVNILRLAGFADERARRVLYHAASPEQAEAIVQLYLQGQGYSIDDIPVFFELVEDPLPAELEEIAQGTIQQYRENKEDRERSRRGHQPV